MSDAMTNRGVAKTIGLVAGPIVAAAVFAVLPSQGADAGAGLDHAARATGAVAALMAVWWLTEAIHISATALMPVTLLPLLGVMPVSAAAAPYANHLIFLFFGGFVIGLAMERWSLHERFALLTIRVVGGGPARLVGGFMLAAAFMSMWVSNTATTLIMLPVAASVVAMVDKHSDVSSRFAPCLMLAIAYAASIGGVGTLVGTPPNLLLAGFARETLGMDIAMARWLLAALPLVAVFLPIAWLLLTRVLFPLRSADIDRVHRLVRERSEELGPMSRGEWTVLAVFIATAALWITRPLLNRLGDSLALDGVAIGGPLGALTDSSIALLAAAVLFLVPVDIRSRTFAVSWKEVERMPWGVLILFGGGLSLASAITGTGLDVWIGQSLTGLSGVPTILVVALVVTAIVFLTEVTSNTAIASAILPVLAAAAPALGVDPIRLIVPATIAASLAFMLPVATPPNAIVYASGRVGAPQMLRAGFVLNLVGIALTVLFTPLFARVLS